MRAIVSLLLTAAACGPDALYTNPQPPLMNLSPSLTVLHSAGAAPSLEIGVRIENTSPASLHLNPAPECELGVCLSVDEWCRVPLVVCTQGGSGRTLFPGKELALTRTLSGEALTAYPPGDYHVIVEVTTDEQGIGESVETVTLPLVP
jgi:hypothetical protein